MVKTIWAVACALLVTLAWASHGALGEDNAAASAAPGPGSSGAAPKAGGSKGSAVYRIGPEDGLRISVWDNRDLTLDVVVRPDGMISLPLIQDVRAEGLTPDELASLIRQRLVTFIKDPQVSVILTQVNAPKVYILGNVARPGTYPLRGDMSVLQALSLAGGFTQFASPRSIRIIRGSGVRQQVRKVNYYRIIDDKGEGNYLLVPGDTVVVP